MSMKIVGDPVVVRQMVTEEKRAGKRIGIVPTMGALHEGHLSLVRRSKLEADMTIVTIFVNPTQFGPAEDLDKYPRTLEHDLALLEKLEVDAVFVPTDEMMYPQGFETFVAPGKIADRLEGKMRPTHFRGVATIVLKLFHLTGADVAFFGQKDYQQCCVIKKMIDDFNIPVEMVVCPIVRESDGLAMSSRNRYLSTEERRQAVVLSQGLEAAQKMLDAQVDTDVIPVDRVRNEIHKTISTASLAKIDDISIVDPDTLDEIGEIRRRNDDRRSAVILLAVRFGATRLIDNALVVFKKSEYEV